MRFCLRPPLPTMPRADKQRTATPPEKGAAAPYAKPHACPQCAAAFGTASSLTRHVRTVHEKRKDHACPQRAATFGEASSLIRHVRAMHPDNSQGEGAWLDLLQDLRS